MSDWRVVGMADHRIAIVTGPRPIALDFFMSGEELHERQVRAGAAPNFGCPAVSLQLLSCI